MAIKSLSKDRLAKILGAKHREAIQVPFYYTPRFFNELREQLQRSLSSRGGRPSVPGWQVVRKTRYSKKTWQTLEQLAENWSQGGTSVSPAQVAARIVEEVISRPA